ncbi:MAG: hypothetical protein HC784_07620 [Hydrococcus sp. CSU_1_8]|nr:hypothetical protein [Hydrococcus sp. CSU_1_8]
MKLRLPHLVPQRCCIFGSIPEVVNLTGQSVFRGDRCPALVLQLLALDSQGRVINSASVSPASKDPKNFSLSIKEKQTAYLSLKINYGDRIKNTNSCSLKLSNLNIVSAKLSNR